MALRIRLARGGAKKRPFYRIVLAEGSSPRDGRFIERLGSYNPMVPKDHPERLVMNIERIKYWMEKGATPSDRIIRFLSGAGLVEAPAIPEQTKKDKPRAKTLERLKEKEEAKKAAAEAESAAKAQADAASEEAAPEQPAQEEVASEEAAEPAAETGEETAPQVPDEIQEGADETKKD